MQGLNGGLAVRSRKRAGFSLRMLPGLVFLVAILWVDTAQTQTQEPAPFPAPPTGQNAGRVLLGADPEKSTDPAIQHAISEAAKKRNTQRQSRIVADTGTIVRLARELCAATEPALQDASPQWMAKKSEEIEKLARSVKERMKME